MSTFTYIIPNHNINISIICNIFSFDFKECYLMSTMNLTDNFNFNFGISPSGNQFYKLNYTESYFDKRLKLASSIRLDNHSSSTILLKTFLQKISFKISKNISTSLELTFRNNKPITHQICDTQFRIKYKFSFIKVALKTNFNSIEYL